MPRDCRVQSYWLCRNQRGEKHHFGKDAADR